MKKVEDLEISSNTSFEELIKQLEHARFQASNLFDAVQILKEMMQEADLRLLSFTGNLVATGIRGILRDCVRRKLFDVLITTCATLDHDLARSFKDYYHGSFEANDEELRAKEIHRLGNVFIPLKHYGPLIEEKMREWLPEIQKERTELSTYELCWELGKRIDKEGSLLYWSHANQIPIVVMNLKDGAVGTQTYFFSRKGLRINELKDEELLEELVWKSEKIGALIVGGGPSKHHTLWWAQFKGGLDYAVQLTTAQEYDGSLSGARLSEAVSWKKVKAEAKHVTVYGDATILLPILYRALL